MEVGQRSGWSVVGGGEGEGGGFGVRAGQICASDVVR